MARSASVELARTDLSATGVREVDLRVMDAEHLDFPDARFDVCFREMDALQTAAGYPLRLIALTVTGRT